MFWRFGGYASVSAIDNLLEKSDITLEELLDESDLIQELKQHNTKLIEYLREEKILQRLLEYVVAPKPEIAAEEASDETEGKGKEAEPTDAVVPFSRASPSEDGEDEREKKRNRYAYVAAEILSSDNWSISSPPLDPLQASYFTKVNEALLDKKTEEMLDLFKSLEGAVKNMLQHVDSPMVMDLLLKIISLEKVDGGQGIVDWLHSQDLMPILLSFLSSEHSWATQTSAGDFLKAIITISANASQNEQSCIGPNELTRQLVSQSCIEKLISDMLKGGNPLTVGVGIVIEVIRKNNSDYDPDVGAEANSVPSSRDPIYLGTLLRMFAQRVPDFMELILSPNHTIGGGDGPVTIRRKELRAAFGGKIEPLGFDRFKTCELMAELLHCSNMGLLNEVGSEEFVKTRDGERERLRAEGKLGISSHQATHTDDDLTMKSSTQTRLGSSPGGSRKLEVQNASDDDGFEEVTHAADLGDDAKDDFDEKPEAGDLLTSTKSETPLSFLDKDDDEFVDEPLSSPRLHTEKDSPESEPEPTLTPLSPTGELAQEVQAIGLEEDTHMVDTNIEDSDRSTAESSKNSPGSSEESAESPPATEEEKSTEKTPATAEAVPPPEPMDEVLHPEDKPAPLFAKKVESPQDSAIQAPESQPTGTESSDTTMGEAGDSSNSILMGNTEEHTQQPLTDTPTAPVVGDFLKMQFVEHKVVPTILDFFFRFPWNNFLHNVVYDVVQQVFNGPMDRGFNRSLAVDLFETGNITMRIVDGQRKSDEAQEKSKMRLGYMGHLTLIAEEVVKFTERHPPELLAESVMEKVMNNEWSTYVEVTLAETRERDNAILGGVRPDMSVGPRQAVMNAVNAANNFGGASSALTEAGLNGSAGLDSIDLANGNGTTGFSLGGTLLSGFGSSSDEEDDEMDEDNDEDGSRNNSSAAEVGHSVPPAPNLDKFDDEEVEYEYLEQLDRETPLFPEGEFSRYISNPSTTTATSGSEMEPPSAPPPPPPPLNIPPSRARRQLAARLALHSKQNAENVAENGELSEKQHRKNLNPFAADEDDDSDNDDDGDFTIGDLEVEEEGKGHMPAGTGLVGNEETIIAEPSKIIVGNPSDDTHTFPSNPSNHKATRASFPSMWPFGNNILSVNAKSTGNGVVKSFAVGFGSEDDRSHFRGADENMQSSDDDSDSDEDGYGGSGREFGGDGQGEAEGKRRLSVTTEAKRRTSLEDDDEDEVVHVGMAEAEPKTSERDEGDLVEIQHAEMQGVEDESK
ncbi:Extragenic suppressor of kinetochore protein 1 [Lachnellula cervina]|uniref:Extragenic suppressor of kinetochore protein 1 n=1 Tax=Lachnellula cervina TaxID=1316786 RepID=A0A7D8Z1K3_9HELO|nr:Extragenic suppressor of kinetochore protein 1 [Lachnellula cervina]